ncbi:hypothetical protein HT747_01215 [Brevibacillus borstelensis]|uniref:hypothetical protein n=1 Tax=Brevibacillus borstelensis TaxID=45462 RepID=UPI001561D3DE|nr:hypothetical protein [Brevibacillus borstelensis]MBE5393804.1 hypothetical protein [Brevibacillus borstelensis]
MDIQFPKKGKKLFKSTKNYLEFSHFGWGDINSQFYGYIKGYKESADTLVDFALASKRIAILDTYIFPILFLYRQFIELSLKSLYLEYSEEPMADKIQAIKQASHNLEAMWKKLKPILIEASDSDDEKDTVKTVESYILQYHRFDKGSFKFRYPIDKDYNPLLKGEERIDIVNLKECMTELDNFFGGADGKLDFMKECKYEQEQYLREIEAEMKAEFEAEMRAEYEAEMRSYMEWE